MAIVDEAASDAPSLVRRWQHTADLLAFLLRSPPAKQQTALAALSGAASADEVIVKRANLGSEWAREGSGRAWRCRFRRVLRGTGVVLDYNLRNLID